jgi:hypothetical protein
VSSDQEARRFWLLVHKLKSVSVWEMTCTILAQAAITKYYRIGSLNNRHFSNSGS